MSTTTTVINLEAIAATILNGGRASDPIRWYDDDLQPLIDSARRINRGELAVDVLQAQLDSLYGVGAIDASEVTFPGAIDPLFRAEVGDTLAVPVQFEIDMAGLTPDHVVWTSSEGHRINAVTPDPDAIAHAAPGTYTVTVDINYAGGHWTHSEVYNVPDGFEPEPPEQPLDPHIDSLDPDTAVVGVEVTVRVLGFNFDETSVVEVDDAGVPTVFVSPTELTATITPAVEGVVMFTVRNHPEEGPEEESNSVAFTVIAPEFDPSDATIAEVQAHVGGLGDPTDPAVVAKVQRILDLERVGKNRSTLVDWLDAWPGVV